MRVADIEAILNALNRADVKYLIVGGLAVIAHGYLRSTVDVDIVIQLERENVLRAMQALGSIGYQPLVPVKATDFADESLRASWREEKQMVVFQMRHSDLQTPRLDIFVTEPFPFDEEYGQAHWEQVGATPTPVLRLERLLQLKRDSGRPQDLADIAELTRIAENRPK